MSQKKIPILLVVLLIVTCVFCSGCNELQEGAKVYRVGIVGGVEAFTEIADGFIDGLTDLGYIQGENIIYDSQIGNYDQAGLENVTNKFVEDKVDLIFVFPTEAAIVAKSSTNNTEIPVVFSIAGVEGNSLVDSVGEPGGNITGVRYPGPDLVVKRFEILLEIAPHIKKHYVPYDPNYPNGPPTLEALRPVAASYGVVLIEDQVTSVEELISSLESLPTSNNSDIDSVQILPELLTQTPSGWSALCNFTQENKLPLVGSMLASAEMGAIFSYCVEFFEVGNSASPLADKVLKGKQAGLIPLVTPEAHLRINYNLTQKLNLTVNDGLLNLADEIIN